MYRVQREPYFNDQTNTNYWERKQGMRKPTIRRESITMEYKELFTEHNCKEFYRQSSLKIKQYEGKKIQKTKYNVDNLRLKCNQNDEHSSPRENGNNLRRFIFYLATEHETLLQILLLLPLILMSAYILVVEKGTLFRVVEQ